MTPQLMLECCLKPELVSHLQCGWRCCGTTGHTVCVTLGPDLSGAQQRCSLSPAVRPPPHTSSIFPLNTHPSEQGRKNHGNWRSHLSTMSVLWQRTKKALFIATHVGGLSTLLLRDSLFSPHLGMDSITLVSRGHFLFTRADNSYIS